jgi:hypothetical protein
MLFFKFFPILAIDEMEEVTSEEARRGETTPQQQLGSPTAGGSTL